MYNPAPPGTGRADPMPETRTTDIGSALKKSVDKFHYLIIIVDVRRRYNYDNQ